MGEQRIEFNPVKRGVPCEWLSTNARDRRGMMNTPYDVYDGPNDIPVCPICGSGNVDWVDCPECGGEGGFDGDELMEADPLWYGPGDYERCETCHGDGGWYQCWNSDKHPKQEGGND